MQDFSLAEDISGLQERFERHLQDLSPLQGPVIAGVSGGPDSMALAELLWRVHPQLVLAHVNYHKRESADRDEQIVRDFARKRGLVFEKLDAPAVHSGNFQDEARTIRYDFYRRLADKYGASQVVLGHHQDDHLETYLIQKERNILPEHYGLAHSRAMGKLEILRPLLPFSKRELVDWCRQSGIDYGIDESNLSDAYLRNRIRHQIIEPMEKRQRQQLLEAIDRENGQLEAFEREWKEALAGSWMERQDAWRILGKVLERLEGRHRSAADLRDGLRKLRNSRKLEAEGFEIDYSPLPGRDRLLVIPGQAVGNHVFSGSELPGLVQKGQSVWESPQLVWKEEGEKKERLALEPSDFPLTLRPARPGDVIAMRFGDKKVSRFLLDRKVPKGLRRFWPVLENAAGKVIWVWELGADVSHFENGRFYLHSVQDKEAFYGKYDIMKFDF